MINFNNVVLVNRNVIDRFINNVLFLKDRTTIHLNDSNDIVHARSFNRDVRIQRMYTSEFQKETFTSWITGKGLTVCDRGVAINIKYVINFPNQKLQMANGDTISVSRRNISKIRRALNV